MNGDKLMKVFYDITKREHQSSFILMIFYIKYHKPRQIEKIRERDK